MIKPALFLAFILISLSTFQKAMAQTENKKQVIALNHIAVYVADLAKATEFYKNILHLEEIPEPFKDNRHTWFTLGPAGQLHLIQGAKTGNDHDKNEHLCFSVPSVTDFITNLNAKKVAYEDWAGKVNTVTSRVDGVKQIYFKDPDGHWLEINDAK